jgi:IS4 transposase
MLAEFRQNVFDSVGWSTLLLSTGDQAMIIREMIERMEQRAPASVMLRAMLENVFSAERLDRLFESTAQMQENKTLLFSTVADIMGLVALKIHPSVHAAYQARQEEIGVTVKAVYDKLQRTEPCVSRMIVRDSGLRLREVVERLEARRELLPGYRVKIVDGNHLGRTERRLSELRVLNAAPLPGHCLVVLDPQSKLVIDVFPCEDAHAQERTLLPALLETVMPDDLLIMDRNLCTMDTLLGIKRRQAYFAIREHGGSLRSRLVGKRKKIGRLDTGLVYEQPLELLDPEGAVLASLRRVTVELNEPTRDGDREIHVLTNLPQRVTSLRVAELYRKRWTIETAFQEIAANFAGEIETLGYPRAALFAFCMALVSFNMLSVILHAMCASQGVNGDEVSIYYVCEEIAHTYRGLDLILDPSHWTTTYAELSTAQLAQALTRIAAGVVFSRYRKHKRGPKKPPPKMNKKHRNHISTARVIGLIK